MIENLLQEVERQASERNAEVIARLLSLPKELPLFIPHICQKHDVIAKQITYWALKIHREHKKLYPQNKGTLNYEIEKTKLSYKYNIEPCTCILKLPVEDRHVDGTCPFCGNPFRKEVKCRHRIHLMFKSKLANSNQLRNQTDHEKVIENGSESIRAMIEAKKLVSNDWKEVLKQKIEEKNGRDERRTDPDGYFDRYAG